MLAEQMSGPFSMLSQTLCSTLHEKPMRPGWQAALRFVFSVGWRLGRENSFQSCRLFVNFSFTKMGLVTRIILSTMRRMQILQLIRL